MQSELLYGARAAALLKGVFPIIVAIVLMVNLDGEVGGISPWIALAAAIYGLWEARGAFKPKALIFDRQGLTYEPPLSGPSTSIQWHCVKGFAIKGSDKSRKLVCEYLDVDHGELKTLRLGDGWSADGKDLFADRLEKVQAHLEEVRVRYQASGSTMTTSVKPARVEATKVPSPQPKPQQATGSVRSGQVYAAQKPANKPSPFELPKGPSAGGSNLTAWGLLAGGVGVGVVSAYAFSRACKNGLCGQGFWEMPDPRLWLFMLVWAACLWAIWAGMRKMTG